MTVLNVSTRAFPLVPELRAGECMRGYLERLANANLLPTLFKTELTGLRAASRHVVRNAGWAAMEPEALAARVCAVDVHWHPKPLYRLGCSLLPGGMVHLQTRQICPACCGEHDIAPCAWELTGYTVCHRHGTKMLSYCDRCRKRLVWRETPEAACSCGRPFAEMATKPGDWYETRVSHLVACAVERSLSGADASRPDNSAPVLGVAQLELLRHVFRIVVILGIRKLCDQYESCAARDRVAELELIALFDQAYAIDLLQAVQSIARLDPKMTAAKLLPGQSDAFLRRSFLEHLDALPLPPQSWLSTIPLHLRDRSRGRGRFFQKRSIPEMERDIRTLCDAATASALAQREPA